MGGPTPVLGPGGGLLDRLDTSGRICEPHDDFLGVESAGPIGKPDPSRHGSDPGGLERHLRHQFRRIDARGARAPIQ
jgi:hypothetical protein